MTTMKTKEIERALLSKGFYQDKTHHKLYWLFIGGNKTSIKTRISHSANEYRDNLLSQVAKQVRLNKKQLVDFVDCSISGEGYLKILKQNGSL